MDCGRVLRMRMENLLLCGEEVALPCMACMRLLRTLEDIEGCRRGCGGEHGENKKDVYIPRTRDSEIDDIHTRQLVKASDQFNEQYHKRMRHK